MQSKPGGGTGRPGEVCREAAPVRTGTKLTPDLSCYAGDMTAVHASPPEPGTRPQYPFAQWFDGQQWTLVRGRDFWGPVSQFMKQIQGSANARRVCVRMTRSDDGRTLAVKAFVPWLS